MRGWSIGLAVSFGVLTGPTTRAEGQEPLSIPVLAVNRVGIPDVTLQQAELQATRLFSAIGITLQWTNAEPAEPYDEAAAQVRVFIVADSRIERNRRKLAIADSDSMAAHAFYEPIVDVARHNGANAAALLGHVIAHEMGHLLLPNDSHSWLGVMRAEWDRKQFDDMAKELLTFTSEQGLLIRTRVRSLRSAILRRPSSTVDSQRPPAAAIRIVTTNEAAVPQEIVASAQIQATQIFARAGITLTWKEGPPVAFSVLMMIVSRSTAGHGDDAMGFAVKGGRVAGVLYRRAADFAERHQIELATVLGHVLAHELGHLLLAGRPHSSSGIMRGNWDRAHVPAIMRSRSGLMFSTEEAELIRRRIEAATHITG